MYVNIYIYVCIYIYRQVYKGVYIRVFVRGWPRNHCELLGSPGIPSGLDQAELRRQVPLRGEGPAFDLLGVFVVSRGPCNSRIEQPCFGVSIIKRNAGLTCACGGAIVQVRQSQMLSYGCSDMRNRGFNGLCRHDLIHMQGLYFVCDGEFAAFRPSLGCSPRREILCGSDLIRELFTTRPLGVSFE